MFKGCFEDGSGRLICVEKADARGVSSGDVEKGIPDGLVKGEGFAFEAVLRSFFFGASEADGWVEVEIEGEVGGEVFGDEAAESRDVLDAKVAGSPLVGDGGVVKSIAKDDFSGV